MPAQSYAIGIRFPLHCFRGILRNPMQCLALPPRPLIRFCFSWPHSLFLFLFFLFFLFCESVLLLLVFFYSFYLIAGMSSGAGFRLPISGDGNPNGNRNLIGSAAACKEEMLGNVNEPPDPEVVDYVEKDPSGRYVRVYFLVLLSTFLFLVISADLCMSIVSWFTVAAFTSKICAMG